MPSLPILGVYNPLHSSMSAEAPECRSSPSTLQPAAVAYLLRCVSP